MNLFKFKPRFSQETGEPITDALYVAGHVCDYCGCVLPDPNDDDSDGSLEVCYNIRERGESEPMFHYFRVLNSEGQDVDVYDLFNSHQDFYYCRSWDGNSCEKKMITESLQDVSASWSLYNTLYQARCRMLAAKLKDGTFTMQDFKLEKSL